MTMTKCSWNISKGYTSSYHVGFREHFPGDNEEKEEFIREWNIGKEEI